MEENSELDNTYLPDVQPSKPEKERREVDQEMTNEYETTDQMENEGLSQQEVDAMNAEHPEVGPDDVLMQLQTKGTVKENRGTDGLEEKGDHRKHLHMTT